MSDTDKYEGLIDAEGYIDYDGIIILLSEIERLREQFKLAYDWVDYQFPDGGMADFAKYIGDVEE